jgi:protein-L-isoaspartate(D-aspartate) O-methyltransferase
MMVGTPNRNLKSANRMVRLHRSLVFGIILACIWIAGTACWQNLGEGDGMSDPQQQKQESSASQTTAENADDQFKAARRSMVDRQLAARDITNPRVLDAMRHVPRHQFVPESMQSRAYSDSPLPIGHGQTISQPYIVGLMTQLAEPHPQAIALDVGTGSGYQAAILSLLCKEVYSIEIVEPLAKEAKKRLDDLRYSNVTVRHGDGYRGWPSEAPFDLIIVAAAPDKVPEPLIEQLKPGGRLVIPVGTTYQTLMLLQKLPDGSVRKQSVAPVAFVPMTGEVLKKDR